MSTSPLHAGERAFQAQMGLDGRVEAFARRMIRDHMPDQHRAFYAQLPWLIVGSVDAEGDPWASVLVGPPGFLSTPDPEHLRIDALPSPGDPLAARLEPGAPLGILGIELNTRRRNRAAGRVQERRADGLYVAVDSTWGNCPQHITARQPSFARPAEDVAPRAVETSAALDEAAIALIQRADTAFVASWAPPAPDEPARGADVSHRGGPAGFIQVEDSSTLLIPDYSGNNLYNTLGNLVVYPRAGLSVVDFTTGDLLQLTGRTELVFDPPTVARLPGAERAWRLHITRSVRLHAALPLRWS